MDNRISTNVKECTMDPDSNLFGRIILLAALIAVNSFFSMSEVAIITLNDAKLRKMAADGHKKAVILVSLVRHPSRFLASIQLGVTLSGFFAAALAADTFAGYLAAAMTGLSLSASTTRAVAFTAVTLLIAFFTLVFGELVPKRIAMQHYDAIAMASARPLAILSGIGRPMVALLSSTSNGVLRLLGIDPNRKPEAVTEEEIRMMIDVGNENGSIEASDKDMINNIFEFDDRTTEEMMTHRTDVVAVERCADLRQVVDTAVENGYSRIPVYQGDLDSIVGILYVKDLLKLLNHSPDAPFDMNAYLREPFYVSESMSCKLLFAAFKAKKIQMAVVVDEYGGTAGIITMEDLLEGIVGSIQDEYDDEEEEISPAGAGVYLIDGVADLEEVCKILSLQLDEEELEDFETIGGYIVHRLGHIPAEDERPRVTVGEILFTVQAMEDRRIAKLKAERQPEQAVPAKVQG